jgi:hypothetical protein
MTSGAADPFVLLTTAADPSAAHLCAALLRSEGIESRLQGESLGPYRLTVGEMAETQVWVPRSRLEEALRLLAEAEGEAGPPTEVEPGSDPEIAESTVWRRLGPALVAATLLALAAWHLLGRLV